MAMFAALALATTLVPLMTMLLVVPCPAPSALKKNQSVDCPVSGG
jgi:hypothetical protein